MVDILLQQGTINSSAEGLGVPGYLVPTKPGITAPSPGATFVGACGWVLDIRVHVSDIYG
jgi:hypothetical protein